jgi:hypothetical protein
LFKEIVRQRPYEKPFGEIGKAWQAVTDEMNRFFATNISGGLDKPLSVKQVKVRKACFLPELLRFR